MPDILRCDFSDAAHCGRCKGPKTRLRMGVAYIFRSEGPAQYAGPSCARRDASNWGLFPDFTRAYANADLDEDLLGANGQRIDSLDQAIDEESRSIQEDFVKALQEKRTSTPLQLRAVLEYLGLRVKLGMTFTYFPCPPYLVGLQRKLDADQTLNARDIRTVLTTAESYLRVNSRAAPSALQACYALDTALGWLLADVTDTGFLESIRKTLREKGCLSEDQLKGTQNWFAAQGVRMPKTDAIRR